MPPSITLSDIRDGHAVYTVVDEDDKGQVFEVVDDENLGRYKAVRKALSRRHGEEEAEPEPELMVVSTDNVDLNERYQKMQACAWVGCGNAILVKDGNAVSPATAVAAEDRIYCREFCREAALLDA